MGSRMRKNKSQRNQRRSHLKASPTRLTTDTETGSIHLRHRLDVKTGMYRGRQVFAVANNDTNTASPKVSDDKSTKSEKVDTKTEKTAAKS